MFETSYNEENHERLAPDVEEENIHLGILVSPPNSPPTVHLPPTPITPCLTTTPFRPKRPPGPPGPPGFTPKAEEILSKYRQVLVNDEGTVEGTEIMENVATYDNVLEDEATNETVSEIEATNETDSEIETTNETGIEGQTTNETVMRNEATNKNVPDDEATIETVPDNDPEVNHEAIIEDGEICPDEQMENVGVEQDEYKETNADEKIDESAAEEDQLDVAKIRLVHWKEKDMEKISDISRNPINVLDKGEDKSEVKISSGEIEISVGKALEIALGSREEVPAQEVESQHDGSPTTSIDTLSDQISSGTLFFVLFVINFLVNVLYTR